MLDVTPFLQEVDRLADRVRSLPQSSLRRGVAAAAYGLARELALRAQRLDDPDGTPRPLPQVAEFTVGDQLAVVGHDLAVALGERGTPTDLTEARSLLSEHAPALR